MSAGETLRDFAARLISAHDGGEPIAIVPDHLVPSDMAAVYAMQDAVIAQAGPVGGWKVMAGGKGEPTCSPLPASRYFNDGARLSSSRHRFVLAEVEIAVRLGADLPGNADAAATMAAIASLHPVLEMVGSPFVDRDAVAANARLGDLQSNGAVIVGPALDRAVTAELATLRAVLRLDGAEAGSAEAGASWEATIDALRWLGGHAASRGLPLKAGQTIITGARVVAPQARAALVEGDLGHWGKVGVQLTY